MKTPPETIARLKELSASGSINETTIIWTRELQDSLISDAESLAACEERCRGLEDGLRRIAEMSEDSYLYSRSGLRVIAQEALAAHGTPKT